jgi:protein arginine kinase activator
MLCESCKKNPATVYVQRTVNGVTTEAHLCEQCAKERGEWNIVVGPTLNFPDFSLGNLFASLLEHHTGLAGAPVGSTEDRCPGCGLTYSDFREQGRLGCARCYTTFREPLKPLIRRLQGSVQHVGKVPRRHKGRAKLRYNLESLRRQLKEAVAKEAFEKAAKFRDQIKEMEERLEEAQ